MNSHLVPWLVWMLKNNPELRHSPWLTPYIHELASTIPYELCVAYLLKMETPDEPTVQV